MTNNFNKINVNNGRLFYDILTLSSNIVILQNDTLHGNSIDLNERENSRHDVAEELLVQHLQ